LAQINEDVAKGIIAVQQAGTITVQQAAPLLNYQEAVAKDHTALVLLKRRASRLRFKRYSTKSKIKARR